jgi:predicted membrane protein (TIGR00267 family)
VTGAEEKRLARRLVLDELFDLSLYRRLREISGPELQKTLDELITVEVRHFAFWQDFFKMEVESLDPLRRIKLGFIVFLCRLFGGTAADLVLEAIEVYGVRKYLSLWDEYKDKQLGEAVRGILRDEFEHEDVLVTRLKAKKINPDRIRNIFLGLNDGMVEILGAVSGFFASFGQSTLVLVAGLTTAVAGSLSMAAGAYVALSSENEIRRTQGEKNRFLGEATESDEKEVRPFTSALIVGGGYFIGAAFPIVPVLFGARSAIASVITAGGMILLISTVLGFLSGMEIRKRALINLVIIAAAVGISYAIGSLVRNLIGVQI